VALPQPSAGSGKWRHQTKDVVALVWLPRFRRASGYPRFHGVGWRYCGALRYSRSMELLQALCAHVFTHAWHLLPRRAHVASLRGVTAHRARPRDAAAVSAPPFAARTARRACLRARAPRIARKTGVAHQRQFCSGSLSLNVPRRNGGERQAARSGVRVRWRRVRAALCAPLPHACAARRLPYAAAAARTSPWQPATRFAAARCAMTAAAWRGVTGEIMKPAASENVERKYRHGQASKVMS